MSDPDPIPVIREKRESLLAALSDIDKLIGPLKDAALASIRALSGGNKLLVAGNGGSAAEAQHFSGELVGRFMKERPGMGAICLHADTSSLTAVGNDYGYEKVFARQVEAQGCAGDVFIAISTSGASKNLIEAVRTAKEMEMATVALLGRTERELHQEADIVIAVPSDYQPAVQEIHLFLLHALAQMIEEAIWG